MMRRSISILVLAGFVASQLAVFPHAHPTADHERDSRPHVHLTGHAHSHAHPHTHRHQAGHDTKVSAGVVAAEQHDSDAAYLPNSGPARSGAASSLLHMLVTLSNEACTISIPTQIGGRAGTIPCPDSLPDDGPLFLNLRTLRI